MLDWQARMRAFRRTVIRAGAVSMRMTEIIAVTSRSSMTVKPRLLFRIAACEVRGAQPFPALLNPIKQQALCQVKKKMRYFATPLRPEDFLPRCEKGVTTFALYIETPGEAIFFTTGSRRVRWRFFLAGTRSLMRGSEVSSQPLLLLTSFNAGACCGGSAQLRAALAPRSNSPRFVRGLRRTLLFSSFGHSIVNELYRVPPASRPALGGRASCPR